MLTPEIRQRIASTISGTDVPLDKQNKSWLLIMIDPKKSMHYYDVTSTNTRKCPLEAFLRIHTLHPDYELVEVQGFTDKRGAGMAADILRKHYNNLRIKPEVDAKVASILSMIDGRT